jgi:ATP-binding cassette, subfamily B, bacterial PglK
VRDLVGLLRDVAEILGSGAGRRFAVLVVMSLAVTALEVIGASAIYLLLGLVTGGADVILGADSPVARLLPTEPGAAQITVALGVLAFIVVRSVALAVRAYIEGRIIARTGVELADRLLSGYLAMPYAFHTRRGSAELIRNTFAATNEMKGGVLRPAVVVLSETVLVIGLVGLLVVTDPLTAVVALASLGGAMVVIQRLLRPRLLAWGRLSHDASTVGLESIQQSLGGIRDIKILGRERWFLERHAASRQRMARSEYLSGAASSLPRSSIEIGLVTTVVVLLVANVRSGGGIDVAVLGMFAYAGIRLQPALQMMVNSVNMLRFRMPMVRDLLDDERLITGARGRHEFDQRSGAVVVPEHPERIEVRDVHLAFPTDDGGRHEALRGVSLTVRRGEFIGLCGPTGGGKSTLLDVIAGLLVPDAGQVLVDGMLLTEEPRDWWRQLGVVSQAGFLVDDTLRRNIALGVPDRDIDQDRLADAVRRAQLDDVLAGLPLGLDTVVGERGIRLSGGQRQRVVLARALYRDPHVLLLDEGTSALDGATEAAVMRALEIDQRARTVIAVAHRLQSIRAADRILVIEAGRIAAEGSWDELAATSEPFQRLLAGPAAIGPLGPDEPAQ